MAYRPPKVCRNWQATFPKIGVVNLELSMDYRRLGRYFAKYTSQRSMPFVANLTYDDVEYLTVQMAISAYNATSQT